MARRRVILLILVATVVLAGCQNEKPAPVVIRQVGNYTGTIPAEVNDLWVEVDRIAKRLPNFAAVVIEPTYRGAFVYVGWTTDVEKNLRYVQARVDRPELVRGISHLQYTRAELERVKNEVGDLLSEINRGTDPSFAEMGYKLSVDERLNRVRLRLGGVLRSTGLHAQIEERFGTAVHIE